MSVPGLTTTNTHTHTQRHTDTRALGNNLKKRKPVGSQTTITATRVDTVRSDGEKRREQPKPKKFSTTMTGFRANHGDIEAKGFCCYIIITLPWQPYRVRSERERERKALVQISHRNGRRTTRIRTSPTGWNSSKRLAWPTDEDGKRGSEALTPVCPRRQVVDSLLWLQ